jgi:hypothetical protein
MQTISVKYVGPTDYKPSRLIAISASGVKFTASFSSLSDGNGGEIKPYWNAAQALAKQLNWSGSMIGGSTKDGYVFVFADDLKFTI